MPRDREEDYIIPTTVLPPRQSAVDLDHPPFGAPQPMPGYVKPRTDVPPVGALSAEALVKDFEKTAQNIEQMGAVLGGTARQCATELVELAQKFKAMEDEVRASVQHINEVAAAFRDEAKTVFVRVENTALMTQDVREMADQMRDRLLGKAPPVPPTSQTPLPTVDIIEAELRKNRDIAGGDGE